MSDDFKKPMANVVLVVLVVLVVVPALVLIDEVISVLIFTFANAVIFSKSR